MMIFAKQEDFLEAIVLKHRCCSCLQLLAAIYHSLWSKIHKYDIPTNTILLSFSCACLSSSRRCRYL